MRDPLRIPIVMDDLCHIWKKQPQLRLGQLISNVCESSSLYYIEDEELIEELKEYYGKSTKDKKEIPSKKKIRRVYAIGDERIKKTYKQVYDLSRHIP